MEAETLMGNAAVFRVTGDNWTIGTGISHEFKRFIETRKQVRPLAGYFDKPIDREQFLATASMKS